MSPTAEQRIEAKLDTALARLERLDVRVEQLADHETRLRTLEASRALVGRFTWADVLKVVATICAACGAVAAVLDVAIR